MASTAEVIPFAVPAQASPAVEITQAEIVSLLTLQAQVNRLNEQAKAAESSIKARLQAGAAVEDGAHVARLKQSSRASVAWKEKAIELAERLGMKGETWAQNVLSHTAKTVTTSLFVE